MDNLCCPGGSSFWAPLLLGHFPDPYSQVLLLTEAPHQRKPPVLPRCQGNLAPGTQKSGAATACTQTQRLFEFQAQAKGGDFSWTAACRGAA